MHLNISQQMKMSQQMKLAPRMIQSMEILQLSLMDLQERVEQELMENVTLEQLDDDGNPVSSGDSSPTDAGDEADGGLDPLESNTSVDQKELVVDSDKDNEADFERLLEMSAEWPSDNIAGSARASANRIDEEGERKHDAMSNMESRPQSLCEYLLEQFAFFNCELHIRAFGEFLIQNLDHNGRLQSTLPEIVQFYGMPLTMEAAQAALELIQKLDPPGVGARDYREMLLLQITDDMLHHDVMRTLVGQHLEDVAGNRLPAIQRRTGYSIDLIKTGIEQVQQLNPYPGRGFEERRAQRVSTDLSVEKNDEGKYVVKLEDEFMPSLRISPKYHQMLKDDPSPETRDWIRKKVESAKWLIESIEQRYSTLKRVAQAIVDFQTAFLDNGPEHIVPLKMQQIADVVGVHVTTVSRAVDDKWIQTSRGLFPLKRFFGGGTQTADGDEVAWDIIRIKLKEIVDGEDKNDPLSDDALVKALAKEGYKLARRTITKYRKNMNIPSSRQRREY